MIVQFVNYFMEDILLIDWYTKSYITFSSKLPFKFYHRLVLYEISCICLKAGHPPIASRKQLTSCSSTPSGALLPSYWYLTSFFWLIGWYLSNKKLFSCKKQLYKRLYPSVGRSVGRSVGPWVHQAFLKNRKFNKIQGNSSKFNKIHDFLQLLAGWRTCLSGPRTTFE